MIHYLMNNGSIATFSRIYPVIINQVKLVQNISRLLSVFQSTIIWNTRNQDRIWTWKHGNNHNQILSQPNPTST